MRKVVSGSILAAAGAFAALSGPALAADPKPADTKSTAQALVWGEPALADLAVLESLEGDNLAEARKDKKATLEIQGTKKDLDGDGIPELFFFVKHPMFCYEELGGCTLLVIRRASLTDPWQEVGVITAPAPNVAISPARAGDFPTLRPLGMQPYAWDGREYKPEAGEPAVPADTP